VARDPAIGTRDCPKCRKAIDRRATFCTSCKQLVATHVVCGSCGELHVPDDLELCWKCGARMRADDKILCPRCFDWSGYEDEFPCEKCGFDPNRPPEATPVGGSAATSTVGVSDGSSLGNGAERAAAEVNGTLVQCPTCYSTVKAGPRCSVCTAVMEI